MKATMTKVSKTPSRYGGDVYLACFKCEDGVSRRSWLDPKNRNFKRWQPFIAKEGVMLDGLVDRGNIIDADSMPKEIVNAL